MPNTNERRQNKSFENAKESETVRESKKLVSKVKQNSRKSANEELLREQRKGHLARRVPMTDEQASERMVDEGNPNQGPAAKKL